MNVYLLELRNYTSDFRGTTRQVVSAPCETDARRLGFIAEQDPVWWDPSYVSCHQVDTEEGHVLVSVGQRIVEAEAPKSRFTVDDLRALLENYRGDCPVTIESNSEVEDVDEYNFDYVRAREELVILT
jgi:hypothetical protein